MTSSDDARDKMANDIFIKIVSQNLGNGIAHIAEETFKAGWDACAREHHDDALLDAVRLAKEDHFKARDEANALRAENERLTSILVNKTLTFDQARELKAENERLRAELHMRDQGDVAVLKKRDRWIEMAGKLEVAINHALGKFNAILDEPDKQYSKSHAGADLCRKTLAEFEAFRSKVDESR